jgi:hypothetical protein
MAVLFGGLWRHSVSGQQAIEQAVSPSSLQQSLIHRVLRVEGQQTIQASCLASGVAPLVYKKHVAFWYAPATKDCVAVRDIAHAGDRRNALYSTPSFSAR